MIKKLILLIVTPLLLLSCTANEGRSYSCKSAPEVFVFEQTEGGANLVFELGLNSSIFSAPPSFALWAELPDGHSQTIYATCKAASGGWGGGSQSDGLPVWDDKRQIEGLGYEPYELDAITTATPTRPLFRLHYQVNEQFFGDTIALLLEFNLPGDFNDYYTRHLGENGQPSILWRTDFVYDGDSVEVLTPSRVIGRSHPTGADSKIYSDLIGITTAKDLVTGLSVKTIK